MRGKGEEKTVPRRCNSSPPKKEKGKKNRIGCFDSASQKRIFPTGVKGERNFFPPRGDARLKKKKGTKRGQPSPCSCWTKTRKRGDKMSCPSQLNLTIGEEKEKPGKTRRIKSGGRFSQRKNKHQNPAQSGSFCFENYLGKEKKREEETIYICFTILREGKKEKRKVLSCDDHLFP